MLKTLALSLLAVLPLAPVAAADLDVDVNTCEKYTICPIVVVQPPTRTCVGLGFGLQGVAACETSSYPDGTCVRVIYGFNEEKLCTTLSVSELP